ncbi:hypothetical protein GCM10010404_81190 [Nonomuraea africana]|uniref:Uncharacterized protein n=1 Tax=Nonomuraea africana TaxID=46171 RepID=A0ABR9KY16_9ACTN|nr:hypothetical protein [Nonomuraea africana]MBE1566503.1 hypothetical protein [Nonomuraea africana]
MNHLHTTLTPERLAELAALGRTLAARSRFVDPEAAARSKKLLRERGETWAASVLMRDLSRRSLLLPAYPWLEDGEMETLVLAEQAEWNQLAEAAGGNPR